MSEKITFEVTDQKEKITFSFSEAARGPQGEPGAAATVTNANVNAAIEDDPSATRNSLDLGTAALADTGTGSSNVILGNDARLTDARTPTAHASSHVTGGTDKIRDASAAQDGLMTTAFAAKLNGIEAGADVTDATNVNAAGAVMESDYSPAHSILVQQSGTGSPSSLSIGNNTLVGRLSGGGSNIDDLSASQVRTLLNVEDGADVTDAANVASTITGATEETTPVDGDFLPMTKTLASGALRKLTWANLKATAKTYFDTLYATAAQGATADAALPKAGGTMSGTLNMGNGSISNTDSIYHGVGLSGGNISLLNSTLAPALGFVSIDWDARTLHNSDGSVALDYTTGTVAKTSDLATVATTGAYADLSGKPTLGNSAALNVGTTAGTVAAGDDAQRKAIEKAASFIAVNNESYVVTATATATDPTPAQGKGFTVFVSAGTATVGGVAYATAGTIIERTYNGGAWVNYVYNVTGGGGGSSELVPLGTVTVSAAADIKLDNIFDDTLYDHYIYSLNILPATDGVSLVAKLRDSTPSTVATIRAAGGVYIVTSALATGVTAQASSLVTVCGNAAGRNSNIIGKINMNSGQPHTITAFVTYIQNSGLSLTLNHVGDFSDTTLRQGILFDFSSGNVASGTLSVWGVLKQ